MARVRSIRALAFVALLAVALGACSGRKTAAEGPSPSPSAPASPTPSSEASGNPLPKPGATPSTSSSPLGSQAGGPCTGHVLYSRVAGEPGTYYIRAATTFPNTWGEGCILLNAGETCRVGWNASYSIPAGDAYLEYQAWAKDAAKPFKTLMIGPLPGEHTIRRAGFPTKIPKTDEVAFRLVLMNAAKTPVAVSDTYVYKVDCRR